MRLHLVLLSAGALLTGLETSAQDQRTAHERAIAAIEKLGGEVIVSKEPAAAVAVILTASDSPGDCLPYLKDVINLHTCDL